MSSKYLQCDCTRAEALCDGQLHDISAVQPGINCYFAVPTAISDGLWQAMAGEGPFTLKHPRLAQLCRLMVATIHNNTGERKQQGLFSETIWFRFPSSSHAINVKVVCHPGDTQEPVMTLLEAIETTAFEL